jgi:hypothetical protein
LVIKTLVLYPASLEILDPDPYSMNPDPQQCFATKLFLTFLCIKAVLYFSLHQSCSLPFLHQSCSFPFFSSKLFFTFLCIKAVVGEFLFHLDGLRHNTSERGVLLPRGWLSLIRRKLIFTLCYGSFILNTA